MDERAMVELLRRHYQPDNRPPAGVFAPEIGSPDGSRRADLIWMPTTIAGGTGRLHGHEIKVTRADVLVELSDPSKADPWARYCTYWWLVVVHPSLVDGLDIPEVWGVMAPPSGRRTRTMTVVRQAPRLHPQNPAPGVARLAAWQLHGHYRALSQCRYDRDHWRKEAARLQRALSEAQAAGPRSSPAAKKVARILADVEQQLRGDLALWMADVDEAQVVAALVDHAATREAADRLRDELHRLVGTVQAAAEPLRRALPALEKAEKAAAGLAEAGGGG